MCTHFILNDLHNSPTPCHSPLAGQTTVYSSVVPSLHNSSTVNSSSTFTSVNNNCELSLSLRGGGSTTLGLPPPRHNCRSLHRSIRPNNWMRKRSSILDQSNKHVVKIVPVSSCSLADQICVSLANYIPVPTPPPHSWVFLAGSFLSCALSASFRRLYHQPARHLK